MPPFFTDLPQNMGDYTLKVLHGTQAHREFYEARQLHVERPVIIELIDTGKIKQTQEQLIATARARASHQLPKVMPVYEAKALHQYFYIAQELPQGQSLQQFISQGKKLPVLWLCRILEQLSDLYISADIERINTIALTSNMIYIEDENNICFLSPAQAEQLPHQSQKEKMESIANTLQQLLPQGVAGATRIQSLVHWLRDGFEGQLLSWSSIASTASLILEQLYPELMDGHEEMQRYKLLPRHQKKKLFSHPAFLALACFIGAFGLSLIYQQFLNAKDNLPKQNFQTTQLYITANQQAVSVQEYKKHLLRLSKLSPQELDLLHKDIPIDQRNHTPEHWDQQMLCLNDNKTRTTAVHSVNYWDAIVYARLNKQSIPSSGLLKCMASEGLALQQEEWGGEQQNYPIYNKSFFFINNAGQISREFNPNTRSPHRGFRTIQTSKKQAHV